MNEIKHENNSIEMERRDRSESWPSNWEDGEGEGELQVGGRGKEKEIRLHGPHHHIAYFWVHSLANWLYLQSWGDH